MGQSRYALKIHASGKETYAPLDDVMEESSFQFSGWRKKSGSPVFMEEKIAYWWNGHDAVRRDQYGCVVYVPMHRPGEVTS